MRSRYSRTLCVVARKHGSSYADEPLEIVGRGGVDDGAGE